MTKQGSVLSSMAIKSGGVGPVSFKEFVGANGLSLRDIERLDGTSLVNEGKVAEQFVGQHLFFRRGDFENPRLNYWLREGAKANAEVDYVVENGTEVLPVEVKAGASGSLKALRQMIAEKRLRRAVRYDAGKGGRQTIDIGGGNVFELVSLPLYAAAIPIGGFLT